MKKNIFYGILIAMSVLPSIAFAANDVLGIVATVGGLIKFETPIISELALLYFFYGLAKFILNAGDEEKRAEGRSIMIWGIIALFVMVSVWGLVRILSQTFIGGNTSSVTIPGLDPQVNSTR